MIKYFVTYEQALALKELDFNEKCYAYFTKHEEFFYFDVDDLSSAYTKNMDNLVVNSIDKLECTAPLKSQVFEFFREKHELCGFSLDIDKPNCYYYGISQLFSGETIEDTSEGPYNNSFEDAELDCIDKLIELLKNEKK